ncbi:MAG: hypothetical protein Q4F06_04000 [Eubacteriales bacterium]|nr:hypothetical protein [Eubacteriales bacterium]
MIHIILMILKIIGIVLLGIIATAVLLILAVLFVPVRYKIRAEYYNSVIAEIKVSWFLSLLRLNVNYNKELNIKAKALFFTLYTNSEEKRKKNNRNSKKEKQLTDVEKDDVWGYGGQDNGESGKSVELSKKDADQTLKKDNSLRGENVSNMDNSSTTQDEMKDDFGASEKTENSTQDEKNEKVSFIGKIKDILNKIVSKIKSLIETVINAVKKVDGARKNLENKINKIKSMVSDPANKEMVRFLWEQIKLLFKKLKPTKYNIYLHFGDEDPEKTAKVLMYLSVAYGFMGIDMDIVPEFDKKVMEGNIFMKGRITVFSILLIALRVYRNKQFRKLFIDN